jgi:hypothetical protein
MKRTPSFRYKLLVCSLATALLGLSSLAPVASADDAIVKTAGNVTYVSGGVGAESINQLSALSKDFNLKLVFALKAGDYISGVGVAIADASGKTILQTTSDGPWFLTKLPTGNYQVVATFAGTAVTRQVSVGAANLTVADLRWASE